jgi:hypothetical protein
MLKLKSLFFGSKFIYKDRKEEKEAQFKEMPQTSWL